MRTTASYQLINSIRHTSDSWETKCESVVAAWSEYVGHILRAG